MPSKHPARVVEVIVEIATDEAFNSVGWTSDAAMEKEFSERLEAGTAMVNYARLTVRYQRRNSDRILEEEDSLHGITDFDGSTEERQAARKYLDHVLRKELKAEVATRIRAFGIKDRSWSRLANEAIEDALFNGKGVASVFGDSTAIRRE